MTLENLSNNFSTTLSGNGGSITSGATSFLVASSTNAPATPFRARIGPVGGDPTEIVLVTTVASLTWTVTRGVEAVPGTGAGSGQAHNDGDQIIAVITTAGLPAALSDTTVASTQAFSDAAAAGSGPGLARIDHKHGMPAAPAGGLGVFGDGSDGTVTFDGTTTILGIVPSPSSNVNGVYTLTRDIFLAAGTLNSGISIKPVGFRIFCAGTFTNNGTISGNGFDAAGTTRGTFVGYVGSTNPGGATAAGTNGGAAATGAGGPGAGSTTYNVGAAGGTGGTGTGGAGGAAGGLSTAPATYSSPHRGGLAFEGIWPSALGVLGITGGNSKYIYGGTGGGAGGGDGTVLGGGGGSGGGYVILLIKAFAGTGAIQARGGAGGSPPAGNTGGGAGGGGGFVLILSSSVASGAIAGQTIDCNGGAKGSPHGTGTDNATAGGTGSVFLVPN